MNDNKILSYPYNNHIINRKIFELLKKENYILNGDMNEVKLFFIGRKKILSKFPENNVLNNKVDEIGVIKNKGIFIPEYILKYENNISMDILNIFLKKEFSNFFFW